MSVDENEWLFFLSNQLWHCCFYLEKYQQSLIYNEIFSNYLSNYFCGEDKVKEEAFVEDIWDSGKLYWELGKVEESL